MCLAVTEKVKKEDDIIFLLRIKLSIPHEIYYYLAVYLTKRGLGF